MNAQERKALKRALISKEKWKATAKERQKALRLQQLKIRDIERSRARWKEKFLQKKASENNEKNSELSESPIVIARRAKLDRKKN